MNVYLNCTAHLHSQPSPPLSSPTLHTLLPSILLPSHPSLSWLPCSVARHFSNDHFNLSCLSSISPLPIMAMSPTYCSLTHLYGMHFILHPSLDPTFANVSRFPSQILLWPSEPSTIHLSTNTIQLIPFNHSMPPLFQFNHMTIEFCIRVMPSACMQVHHMPCSLVPHCHSYSHSPDSPSPSTCPPGPPHHSHVWPWHWSCLQ